MASFSEAPDGDAGKGAKIFKTKCAQCHVAEKGGGHKQVRHQTYLQLTFILRGSLLHAAVSGGCYWRTVHGDLQPQCCFGRIYLHLAPEEGVKERRLRLEETCC